MKRSKTRATGQVIRIEGLFKVILCEKKSFILILYLSVHFNSIIYYSQDNCIT